MSSPHDLIQLMGRGGRGPNVLESSLEIIWNNTEIKCNGETFFYKDWYEKGIKFLEHFFDFRINNYYDFETFRYMFNLRSNDFLKYYNMTHHPSLTLHFRHFPDTKSKTPTSKITNLTFLFTFQTRAKKHPPQIITNYTLFSLSVPDKKTPNTISISLFYRGRKQN